MTVAADKPQRIQLSRKRGWRLPPNTVVVSRPSKWGNPYRVQRYRSAALAWHVESAIDDSTASRHRSRSEAVKAAVTAHAALYVGDEWAEENRRLAMELRGKNLACWCKAGEPCHADVLLEVANGN